MALDPRILAALKRRVRKRRQRNPERTIFPIALALEFEKGLEAASRDLAGPVIDDIMRAYVAGRNDRMDVNETQIRALLRRFRELAKAQAADDAVVYERHGRSIAKNQQVQFEAQIRNVLGVDIDTATRGVRRELDSLIKTNVNLITKANDEWLRKIERLVRKALLSNDTPSSLQSMLERQGDVLGNRARLIARDQTNKFFSAVTKARNEDMGLTSYNWSTSLDERVRGNPGGRYPNARPSHWVREGQLFQYNKPPIDGHAGEAIQCRCTQTPNFQDFFKG